jgi:Ca2+-binding RTX toxin-like protein
MAEFVGTDDDDVIVGETSDDVLTGGLGADTLTGGAGADLFVVDSADSSALNVLLDPNAGLDVITDWSAEDRLLFRHAQPTAADALFAGVADSYDTAFDMAQTAFGDGFEFASIKVGSDVFVFAPRTDSVVKLEGADPDTVTSASLSSDPSPDGEDTTLSSASESFEGGSGGDTIYGLAGEDTLMGGDGADQIYAGDDNDSVDGGEGLNYLRGEDGDDMVQGGAQHDDINGNMGRDTIFSGDGDDWVHGGKDDDAILAGAGNDLVFGDRGSDTAGGGEGDDVVHGGDGDDIVRGDDGADTLFGDAGRDTLDGGNDADIFVAQANSGDDRVIFFNAGEGDRVQLEAGASYSLSQEGSDTVIQLDGGRMVLAGVQLSSLPEGWLIGA